MNQYNQKPIRVLQIVTHMNRGGLETMLMNYYRNIDRSKVEFDFLVHREERADYDDEIEMLGGKIYRLPRLNPFSFKYLKAIDDFFKTHKEYKIVHCHQDCLSGIPLKYAKKNGVPFTIAHSHNSNQDKNLKYIIKLIFKQNISKYADDLFACSKNAGNWMFNKKEFKILNNAIDFNQYTYNEIKSLQIKERLGIKDKFVIGHVGRFNKQKNHDFIIDVFRNIVKINDNSILLLVGTGYLQEKIRGKVNNLGLNDKVIFLGTREDVNDIMQAMDAFLFPSIYEGLGIVLVEAQAAGLECIISSTIPNDGIITDKVEKMSLNESPSKWAIKINQCKNTNRESTKMDITDSKFDIKYNSKLLEEFYLNNFREYGGI